jgi:hypothetical protein
MLCLLAPSTHKKGEDHNAGDEEWEDLSNCGPTRPTLMSPKKIRMAKIRTGRMCPTLRPTRLTLLSPKKTRMTKNRTEGNHLTLKPVRPIPINPLGKNKIL